MAKLCIAGRSCCHEKYYLRNGCTDKCLSHKTSPKLWNIKVFFLQFTFSFLSFYICTKSSFYTKIIQHSRCLLSKMLNFNLFKEKKNILYHTKTQTNTRLNLAEVRLKYTLDGLIYTHRESDRQRKEFSAMKNWIGSGMFSSQNFNQKLSHSHGTISQCVAHTHTNTLFSHNINIFTRKIFSLDYRQIFVWNAQPGASFHIKSTE